MINVEHIQKSFGNTLAVRDVSFSVQPGQTLGLLGPNGAGKTSSLRILCGLLTPDSGRVHIDGIDVIKHPVEAQKKLGVLPDNCGLYTRLTAAENLRYFAQLYGLSKSHTQYRIQVLAQQLDMQNILHRKTLGFSQGERMKVALARALMHEPPYLILDEPTNGLDVLTTRAVRALLLQLKNDGTCLIFSSHLMHEVTHLCDELSVITQGQVSASGTPDAIIEQTGCSDLESAFAQLCLSNATHATADGSIINE
ncbi:ATP-binding cassette domain-containing protein [Marinagarivorans cellulosilyticus]|uniref:Sodium transport system ATP-binding protein n=1 Tax=Marinagarivorans cellulosilyticus TaxID=2721545 RepID=A0AAN2BKE9_9GAMM|nr:ATP-binding cassette domain-containing protein [Marinagarivorans cellulosilyticus]BCD97954.1 sodium transport system ATP-binding protein [Marinagarivorans cellulosilyticus]